MRSIVFALPLFAASVVFAQAPAANPPVIRATPSFNVPNGMASCPVGMSAQLAAGGQTMWTISFEDARQPKSDKPKSEAPLPAGNFGVHVEINATKGNAIRQVELAVYFLPPGSRILLLQSNIDGDTATSKKTFNLSANGRASFKLAGDLLIGPAAGITRVRLLSITYADGTSWRAVNWNACSIAPNGFKLVSAQ